MKLLLQASSVYALSALFAMCIGAINARVVSSFGKPLAQQNMPTCIRRRPLADGVTGRDLTGALFIELIKS